MRVDNAAEILKYPIMNFPFSSRLILVVAMNLRTIDCLLMELPLRQFLLSIKGDVAWIRSVRSFKLISPTLLRSTGSV
jgi:hypothetical protein